MHFRRESFSVAKTRAPHAIDLPLLRTTFDHCAYGGSRPKTSLLLHCVPLLSSLDKRCDGHHQHASWSPVVGTLNRLDDLSYPNQLCRDWANLLVQQLVALGAHAPPAELSQLTPTTSVQPVPPLTPRSDAVGHHWSPNFAPL